VISTGSISFDAALGVGGFPRGRVVEVFGPESSGKTTITLQVIAEAQKTGGMAAFVDAEHALDPAYAKKLASMWTTCWFRNRTTANRRLRSRKRWCVRMPSMCWCGFGRGAGAQGRTRWRNGRQPHGAAGAADVQALRKLTGTVSKSRTCLIFINQIREKIGVMFGNPETTTGGAR